jgi:hypothetical protein
MGFNPSIYPPEACCEFHVLDRQAAVETVRLIREHIVARIASLSNTP